MEEKVTTYQVSIVRTTSTTGEERLYSSSPFTVEQKADGYFRIFNQTGETEFWVKNPNVIKLSEQHDEPLPHYENVEGLG